MLFPTVLGCLWDFLYVILYHLQMVAIYFFLIWMPFISFSCVIALDKTSSTILKNNDESGYPRLDNDLREKSCSFSPLSGMSAVGLLYVAFLILICTFSMHSKLRVFIMNGCCILANTSPASIEEIRNPWWLKWLRICLQCSKPGFNPCIVKIPWRR